MNTHAWNEEKMNPLSQMIHDLDIISNSTDKRRAQLIHSLKVTMSELKSMQKKAWTRLRNKKLKAE